MNEEPTAKPPTDPLAFLEKYKAAVAAKPHPSSPEGIAETKKLIAAWKAFGAAHPDYTPHPKRATPPANPGQFTENERAWLLKGVIDALAARPDESPEFRIWQRYGLSRIYFADDSWLSYAPSGVCIYGPDKKGTAYAVRVKLRLKVIAKKGAIKD
jgi:hypothetical protein